MTEQDKEDAVTIAMLVSGHYFNSLEKLGVQEDEERFIRACRNYYRNSSDLKMVCFGIGNGIDYISADEEALTKFNRAMLNPVVPALLRRELQEQRARWLGKLKPSRKAEQKIDLGVFVYLMKNSRSGLVKIGLSRNPKHREATLQGEEPEIELISAWVGGRSDELALHQLYAGKRVRGEWFKLDDADIEGIKNYFRGKG